MEQPELFKNAVKHPGKLLKEMLDERNWSQEELAVVTGRHRGTISNIVAGKTGISPDMAVALAAAFGNSATDWMKWSAMYDLSRVESDADQVKVMADLYAVLPIREMQKRGWIKDTADAAELTIEIERFIGGSLADGIKFPVATSRTVSLSHLNASEKAWVFRARQLSTALPVAEFSRSRLQSLEKKLRQLAAFPKEVSKLARLFADYGIRFVVVELLPGAKIDGAAFWIGDKPVIAVSLRFDRIDNFWFTVMHEFAHVKNNDAYSIDQLYVSDEQGQLSVPLVEEEAERIANDMAADALVPKEELESFIARLAPLYPELRIVQFANRIKMHPGIIVGQLQRREELGYAAHRHFLVKIRQSVIETSLTDGWGQSLRPGII